MSIHRKSVPWVADQNSCTNSRGRTHDCSICHKSFKTGMALGGHMRCHKKEREGGSSSALAFEFDLNQSSVGTEVAKNQQSESESRGVRFASEFDLNLPASPELGLGVEESEKKKMEEEEEEEVESPLAAKKPRFFEFFK
ncbi:Zinc finger protein 1 [Linum perenne]